MTFHAWQGTFFPTHLGLKPVWLFTNVLRIDLVEQVLRIWIDFLVQMVLDFYQIYYRTLGGPLYVQFGNFDGLQLIDVAVPALTPVATPCFPVW